MDILCTNVSTVGGVPVQTSLCFDVIEISVFDNSVNSVNSVFACV